MILCNGSPARTANHSGSGPALPARVSGFGTTLRAETKRNLGSRCTALVLLFVFTFLANIALAVDVPPPPTGFTWKQIPQIKAAFLFPEGWHFRREEGGGTLGLFFTKENINEKGEFLTGLTVNVLRDRESDSSLTAKKFVVEVTALGEGGEIFEKAIGPLQLYGSRVRVVRDKPQAPITMQYLAIANRNTNTLYLLWFESLEVDWEQAWVLGEPMLANLAIDDEI